MSVIVKVRREFEGRVNPHKLNIYRTYKYLLISGDSKELNDLMRKLKSESIGFEVIIQSL